MPLFGGLFIDKLGLHNWIIVFALLTVLGQGVFTISGYMTESLSLNDSSFTVAIIGRAIYGLGGEYLGIVLSTIISNWFEGKELSLALGTILSVSWLGNTLTYYAIPSLVAQTSFGFSLTIGTIICLLSLMFGLFLIPKKLNKYKSS